MTKFAIHIWNDGDPKVEMVAGEDPLTAVRNLFEDNSIEMAPAEGEDRFEVVGETTEAQLILIERLPDRY